RLDELRLVERAVRPFRSVVEGTHAEDHDHAVRDAALALAAEADGVGRTIAADLLEPSHVDARASGIFWMSVDRHAAVDARRIRRLDLRTIVRSARLRHSGVVRSRTLGARALSGIRRGRRTRRT